MKFFRKFFFTLFFSIVFTIFIILLFKPILFAQSLIFPYSIHPFDIANKYPKIWLYIKIIYVINLFITVYLILNSIYDFLKLKLNKKINTCKTVATNKIIKDKNSFNLLIGFNSENNEKIFIPEKGLYQNILVTGTIGSRENKFYYVSIIKSIN